MRSRRPVLALLPALLLALGACGTQPTCPSPRSAELLVEYEPPSECVQGEAFALELLVENPLADPVVLLAATARVVEETEPLAGASLKATPCAWSRRVGMQQQQEGDDAISLSAAAEPSRQVILHSGFLPARASTEATLLLQLFHPGVYLIEVSVHFDVLPAGDSSEFLFLPASQANRYERWRAGEPPSLLPGDEFLWVDRRPSSQPAPLRQPQSHARRFRIEVEPSPVSLDQVMGQQPPELRELLYSSHRSAWCAWDGERIWQNRGQGWEHGAPYDWEVCLCLELCGATVPVRVFPSTVRAAWQRFLTEEGMIRRDEVETFFRELKASGYELTGHWRQPGRGLTVQP